MWDLVVVGAGPAGATAALGALAERPDASVLLLDRADFPRDKACGDGIASHVLDVLAEVGVHDLLDDQVPVHELALRDGDDCVRRVMARPTYVVPRTVLDARLVDAAVGAGAELQRHRVRTIDVRQGRVVLDGSIEARVVVGADGAHSFVREAVGVPAVRHRALAIRGYAPTSAGREKLQEIVFGRTRQPSYAWSFDRGDGYANVGYGELLRRGRPAPSREVLLEQLEELLPGSSAGGAQWRGHHLPLSSWRWRQPDGRVLLAGDAAGLINPMTGEGIYYAVATGVRAGRAAVCSAAADGDSPGARYRREVRSLLAQHLQHTAAVARLQMVPGVIPAGIRAASRDQRIFDDLVEVGLGRGLVTPRVLSGLTRNLRR